MKKSLTHAAVLALGAVQLGCPIHQQGRMYSMKDGRTSGVTVENAGSGRGTITGYLPSGEPCQGEFTTVGMDEARQFTDGVLVVGENAETSVVMLRCGVGISVQCTLARRPGAGFSYGACKDRQGTRYNVMF